MTSRSGISFLVWVYVVLAFGIPAVGFGQEGTPGDIYVNGECGNDDWSGADSHCIAPDGPKRTIQAAIDAEVDGDVIVVMPGVYTGDGNRDLVVNYKAITIRSIAPTDRDIVSQTVIDCEGTADELHQGIYLNGTSQGNAVLEGLTIRNASYDYYGAGVYAVDAEVRNCHILNNRTFCRREDRYYQSGGGGVYCERSIVQNCLIAGNHSSASGGGVHSVESTIQNCIIRDNVAEVSGGGIWESDGIIHDHNRIENCLVMNNVAWGRCVYSYVHYGGGGICTNSLDTSITNCTIIHNETPCIGGGIFARYCRANLTNCIVRDNRANWGDEIGLLLEEYNNSYIDVNYCNIKGGRDAVYFDQDAYAHSDYSSNLTWGDGNIDADPCFAFDDDYRLMPGSCCIDAGTGTVDPPVVDSDLDGRGRVTDGDGDGSAVADMGAYEFDPCSAAIALNTEELAFFIPEGSTEVAQQTLSIRNCGGGTLGWQIFEMCPWLTVEPGSGISSGESAGIRVCVDPTGLEYGEHHCVLKVLNTAGGGFYRQVSIIVYIHRTFRVPSEYENIQAGVDATAVKGDVVLVANGEYYGWDNVNIDPKGKDIVIRSENGPEHCKINCWIARAFRLSSGESRDCVIEGFTIANGIGQTETFYSITNPHDAVVGGAIYCELSSPTIRNCIIQSNTGGSNGGGAFCAYSKALFENCVIKENDGGTGGGVYFLKSLGAIRDCTISYNTGYNGGGIACCFGNIMIDDCSICYNNDGKDTLAYGGGVSSYSAYPAHIVIANCTISHNRGGHGGGVCCSKGPITNCVIESNKVGEEYYHNSEGGGLAYCSGPIRDCIIRNNLAGGYGGGVYQCNDVQTCIVTGNSAWGGGGIENYLNSNSMIPKGGVIKNCLIADNEATYAGGIGAYGYSVINCTVVNNTSSDDSYGIVSFGYDETQNNELKNTIIWGNTIPSGIQLDCGSYNPSNCCIEGWAGGGEGNISSDPCFIGERVGKYYLSQVAAGQGADSPCVDAGAGTAAELGLDMMTTRADQQGDAGVVDMGYHYRPQFDAGDVSRDGYTNLKDIAVMMSQWLMAADDLSADIVNDGVVDVEDLDALLNRWLGTMRVWGDTVFHSELNSGDLIAAGPCLSADGRRLFYELHNTNWSQRQLMMARREDITGPFGAGTVLTGLGDVVGGPHVSVDGQRLYYSVKRSNDRSFWIGMATWNAATEQWEPTRILSEIHYGGYADGAPTLTADELTIYFASSRPDGTGLSDIWTASRSSVSEPFSAAVPVTEVNTTRYEHHPSISRDGRTLYFVSEDEAAGWNTIIYRATRSSANGPFDVIEPADFVDSDAADYCPFEWEDHRAFLYSTDDGIYEIVSQSVPMY